MFMPEMVYPLLHLTISVLLFECFSCYFQTHVTCWSGFLTNFFPSPPSRPQPISTTPPHWCVNTRPLPSPFRRIKTCPPIPGTMGFDPHLRFEPQVCFFIYLSLFSFTNRLHLHPSTTTHWPLEHLGPHRPTSVLTERHTRNSLNSVFVTNKDDTRKSESAL